jgi:hypothetical protein
MTSVIYYANYMVIMSISSYRAAALYVRRDMLLSMVGGCRSLD